VTEIQDKNNRNEALIPEYDEESNNFITPANSNDSAGFDY